MSNIGDVRDMINAYKSQLKELKAQQRTVEKLIKQLESVASTAKSLSSSEAASAPKPAAKKRGRPAAKRRARPAAKKRGRPATAKAATA